MRTALALLLICMLSGCASAGAGSQTAPPPTAESATTVDFSCKVDSDCKVKNIGNCCGEFPSCVNRDSPTFPKQVQEQCAREGRMSICGFPVISGCRCVENRCQNITGASPTAEEI